jgi:hypothetical protein
MSMRSHKLMGGGGWGVVKSLGRWGSGPVGLLHTQKVGTKYKKPPQAPNASTPNQPDVCRVSVGFSDQADMCRKDDVR